MEGYNVLNQCECPFQDEHILATSQIPSWFNLIFYPAQTLSLHFQAIKLLPLEHFLMRTTIQVVHFEIECFFFRIVLTDVVPIVSPSLLQRVSEK